MDESEAAPNIPLVLDEELDAMKIKISQIKSDIQREKVRGAGVRGWTRLALQLRGQQHLPAGEFCWASDPLQVSGTCWGPESIQSTRRPIRLGAVQDRVGGGCPTVPVTTAPMGSESQVGDTVPPEGLTCTRQTPGCFWRGAVF